MKQHITIEQIKELNDSQMEKLKEILVYSLANFKEGDIFYIEDDSNYISYYEGYSEEDDDEEDMDYIKAHGEYTAVKKNGHKNFDIIFPHFERSEYIEGEYEETQTLSYYVDDIRVFPLLSIGKMIEILRLNNYKFEGDWSEILSSQCVCDCLWEYLKASL